MLHSLLLAVPLVAQSTLRPGDRYLESSTVVHSNTPTHALQGVQTGSKIYKIVLIGRCAVCVCCSHSLTACACPLRSLAYRMCSLAALARLPQVVVPCAAPCAAVEDTTMKRKRGRGRGHALPVKKACPSCTGSAKPPAVPLTACSATVLGKPICARSLRSLLLAALARLCSLVLARCARLLCSLRPLATFAYSLARIGCVVQLVGHQLSHRLFRWLFRRLFRRLFLRLFRWLVRRLFLRLFMRLPPRLPSVSPHAPAHFPHLLLLRVRSALERR